MAALVTLAVNSNIARVTFQRHVTLARKRLQSEANGPYAAPYTGQWALYDPECPI